MLMVAGEGQIRRSTKREQHTHNSCQLHMFLLHYCCRRFLSQVHVRFIATWPCWRNLDQSSLKIIVTFTNTETNFKASVIINKNQAHIMLRGRIFGFVHRISFNLCVVMIVKSLHNIKRSAVLYSGIKETVVTENKVVLQLVCLLVVVDFSKMFFSEFSV